MESVLYKFSGNFQVIGGHRSPELTVQLLAGNFLTAAVGTDLDEVQLFQLVAISHFHISGDLHAVGSGVTVDSDLTALGFNNSNIVVRHIAAADIADAVFITILAPILVDEVFVADQAFTPVGSAVRVQAAQLVLMGRVTSDDPEPFVIPVLLFFFGTLIGESINLNILLHKIQINVFCQLLNGSLLFFISQRSIVPDLIGFLLELFSGCKTAEVIQVTIGIGIQLIKILDLDIGKGSWLII